MGAAAKPGRLQAVLRIALIASCAGAFELSHAGPRMRLHRRAAMAADARPLIMGQPDELHDTPDEPPLPEECGPYITIKGKSINAFGALYGVQSVLLLGPLWCGSGPESGQFRASSAGEASSQTPPAPTRRVQARRNPSARRAQPGRSASCLAKQPQTDPRPARHDTEVELGAGGGRGRWRQEQEE